MAYQPINSSEIEVGKPIKKELFTKIKENFETHQTAISALALGASPVEVFNFDVVNATAAPTLTGMVHHKAFIGFTVSTVEIQIFEKGSISTGILEVDVKKNSTLDDVGMTSILSVKPSINFAVVSDYAIATGTLNPALQEISAGEYLRLDITSLPSIPLGKFRVIVYGVIA